LENASVYKVCAEDTGPGKEMSENIPIPCSFSAMSEAPRSITSLPMDTHLADPARR
jgi:hypothetical protein